MKLLFLCHRIPYPPDKGDKIRSYHELTWFAQRHRVDLFTLVDDPADAVHVESLRRRVAAVTAFPLRRLAARLRAVAALLAGDSLSAAHFAEPALRRALVQAVATRGYDVIFVFSSNMAPLVFDLGVPLVLDFVDVDSAKFAAYAATSKGVARWLYGIESARLRALERRLAERAGATLLCTPRESAELRAFSEPRRLETIPNGTDTEYFSPEGDRESDSVVFTGAMDYRANVDAVVWFANEVWPMVRARRKSARFAIVGSNPTPEVTALGALEGITVTGRVPDVRPYLRRAALAVAPLRIARGVQNKVLEALACGTAVVATRAALGGLSVPTPGVRVADDSDSFAAEVVDLLSTPDRRQELGTTGREYVVAEHRWERSLERLERVVAEVASSESSHPVEDQTERLRPQ